MLKHGEVNPLAVWGLRRLEHCPPHFTSVDFNAYCDEKVITDWIWSNLSGRFYFGDIYRENPTGAGIIVCKRAAFEQGAEASFFGMMLDSINKSEILF
jgi:hypothetical protein